MALSDAEIWLCKRELGFNLLNVGAEPYIGIVAIFNRVIQVYLGSTATTTSATAVTASTTATPVTLTLADATGFVAGDSIVVDVDDLQEVVTARSLSGASLGVVLKKAHTGTYPVSVEGPEQSVREFLRNIRNVKDQIRDAYGAGAIKKVDEVEFYDTRGALLFGNLGQELKFWRQQLASAFGIDQVWSSAGSGCEVAVY